MSNFFKVNQFYLKGHLSLFAVYTEKIKIKREVVEDEGMEKKKKRNCTSLEVKFFSKTHVFSGMFTSVISIVSYMNTVMVIYRPSPTLRARVKPIVNHLKIA